MTQEILDVNKVSADVAALLAKAAEQQAENETTSIPFISLRGKKFTVGEDKLGNKLRVIVLADIFDNAYYDRAYDPSADETNPPACFSIYDNLVEARPHPTSPVMQSDSCNTCAMNEFGSAKQGKGKACRNGRRILIASVGEDGNANLSDLAIINMSPTALKGFSRYTKSISITKKLPLWAVITELSFDEDQSYPILLADYINTASVVDIEKIAQRLDEFKELVSVVYDVSNYEAPPTDDSPAKKSKMSA